MEYEAQAVAIRKRTAHLKALRLAKEEAQAQTDEPPATQTKRRTETRRDK